jgi:hypothetical protein
MYELLMIMQALDKLTCAVPEQFIRQMEVHMVNMCVHLTHLSSAV